MEHNEMKQIKSHIIPTKEQLEWADAELGVLIHYDVQVFEPSYSDWRKQWDYQPDPSVFNPTQLDTDQWIRTAKAAGANYAVLVAKHCSGFSLWPTEAHEYSVKSSPWRNGQGDIVKDFILSCEKYGLRPGLYYSTVANAYYNVDNPGMVISGDPNDQKIYNDIVLQQLRELWSNYGKLFEIWFDGGTLSPEQGGPDIKPLLMELQPQAVCFQGPRGIPSLLRWVGNESGHAPNPCWSTTEMESNFAGDAECPIIGIGDPDGTIWAPAEADMPNRKDQWFWYDGEDHLLYTQDELINCYYNTVGSNTNLLIGMVIDNRGLVPTADEIQFKAFGEELRRRFNTYVGETSGQSYEFVLSFAEATSVNHLMIMEDIANGERIREYVIEAFHMGEWIAIRKGVSVGHKRLERFETMLVTKIRLLITKATDTPNLRSLKALYIK